MSLYKVETKFQALIDRAEENEGDITEFAHEFEEVRADWKDETENYWRMIKNLTAEAEVIKNEKMRLQKKQTAKENTIQFLKDRLAESMRFMGEEKVKTVFGSLSFRRAESTKVVDPEIIPDEYCKIERKPKLTEIKKAIEEGKEVPGAYIDVNFSLQVR